MNKYVCEYCYKEYVKKKYLDKHIDKCDKLKHKNLITFGEEDTSIIGDEYVLDAFRTHTQSVYKMVKHIHFNKTHIEFRNVYISNKRSNTVMIYDGEKFVAKDLDNIIKILINNAFDCLNERYETVEKELTQLQQKNFKKWIKIQTENIENNEAKIILHETKINIKNLLHEQKKLILQ